MKLCSTIVVFLGIFDHLDNIFDFLLNFIDSFNIWKPLLNISRLFRIKLILIKDLSFWETLQHKCKSKRNDKKYHCLPHKLAHLPNKEFGESLSFCHIWKIYAIQIFCIFINMVQSVLDLKLNFSFLVSFLEVIINFVLYIKTNDSVVKPISVQLSEVIMSRVEPIRIHIIILLQIP